MILTTKTILHLVSFILLFWLLVESLGHMNIAASKNRFLLNIEKQGIDNLSNIDSVKSKAKTLLDQMSRDFEVESDRAVFRSRLIVFVILIQVALIFSKHVGFDAARSRKT